MARFPNFVGGSYTSRSIIADASRLVNLYPELIEAQDGKNNATLYGCPGIAAFATLPTAPTRGIWIGEGRLFAASGAHLYEVFTDRTYTDLGDIGTDGKPVQIFPNGNQIMIISAGRVYIHTGVELVQPIYTSASGTVGTSGTTVQLGFGDTFDLSMVGATILINGVAYTVASFTDPFHLELTTSAGTQASVTYAIPVTGKVDTNGTAVTLVNDGDAFTFNLAGATIHINGVSYTVASVTDGTHLTLTTSAGSQSNVDYYALPPVAASCGAFLDGYFIVAAPDTKQINISRQWDGLHWDPLDFAIKEGYPDNIAFLLADHEELYVFGTQTCEVWRNVGDADFPFQRDAGAFMHMGNVARWATARFTTSVAWLEGEPNGWLRAYRAMGFNPVRVSTHAVEYAWSQYSTTSDAEGFVYTMDGHEFWQINFPTADKTWVYDAVTNLWHERQNGSGGRHRARNHGFVFGKHLVGDYASGVIYELSNTLYDDAGTAIQCIRRCPHLSLELERRFYFKFRVEMELATALTATLRWSNDGAQTFTSAVAPSSAVIADGDPTKVIAQEWRRLGSGRDRVFELQLQATSRIAIINADLDVQ